MGWSCALACTCAFLLIFMCTAFVEDGPDFGQRDITDEIIGSLPDMDQTEVDLTDLLDPEDAAFIEQRLVKPRPLSPEVIKAFVEKARLNPPLAGPRSFVPPPSLPFPPGQPSPSNLQAVCADVSRRPRYPKDSLPHSGFSYLYRQADAINRVESWFGACCHGNNTQDEAVTLCCVTQAWEQAMNTFCEEEFSVKTSHHHCCKKKKEVARMKCFQGVAPNPAYLSTNQGPESHAAPEPGFTFNPNTCRRPRSALSPRGVLGKRKRKPPTTARDADINFPPGRPTADNIDSVCRLRKLRPLYLTKCLPRAGYGWLARQSKAVNRLERGFKVCCKGQEEEAVTCADGKWREVMDRFCEEGKVPGSPCCDMAAREERYVCFSSAAPHPGYGRELLFSQDREVTEPTLGNICETQKIIKKKLNFGFPVQSLVSQCCFYPADERTACVQKKIVTLSERLCLETKLSPAVRQCCSATSQDSAPSCFSGLLINAITKATKYPRIRKRKCPLLS